MQPQSDAEYRQLLTDVIKKQIVILGPDITLIKARNVPGLSVADDGTVTAISGEPQSITQALIDQFVQLSGLIVKKTMEPLLMYHSDNSTTNMQSTSPAPSPSPVQPTAQPQPISVATQPATPPMPEGTQPIAQMQSGQSAATPVSSEIANPSVAAPTPTANPEIDMDTQKIINEALQQV